MEFFQGDLAHYRLSLLVPALTARSGLLSLERGAVRRQFVILNGELISESSNAPGEHLSQVLADLGILDAARSAKAFAQAEAENLPLGAFLVEKGWVSSDQLEEALAHKARRSFFDCYGWESGELTFSPNLPAAARGGVALALPLRDLHREALERRELYEGASDVSDLISLARTHLRLGNYERSAELAGRALEAAPVPEAQALYRDAERRWAATLADLVQAIDGALEFRPLPHPPPPGLNSDDLYLYAKLSAKRRLSEILPTLPMGEAATYRSLRRLWEKGLIHAPGQDGGLTSRFFESRSPQTQDLEAQGDDLGRAGGAGRTQISTENG